MFAEVDFSEFPYSESEGSSDWMKVSHKRLLTFLLQMRDATQKFDIRVATDGTDNSYSEATIIDEFEDVTKQFYCCPLNFDPSKSADQLTDACFLEDERYPNAGNSKILALNGFLSRRQPMNVNLAVGGYSYVHSAYTWDNGGAICFAEKSGASSLSSMLSCAIVFLFKDDNVYAGYTWGVAHNASSVELRKLAKWLNNDDSNPTVGTETTYNLTSEISRSYYSTEPSYFIPSMPRGSVDSSDLITDVLIPVIKGYTQAKDISNWSDPCIFHVVEIDDKQYLVNDFYAIPLNE